MTRLLSAVLLLGLVNVAAAGVALDMVTTDGNGAETERSQIYAQDGVLRLDSDGGPYAGDVSMIFLGDRFLVLDHDEETYIVMDEAMLNQITTKMNEALAQMQAQLAQLPPEQRAMAEQMMQNQMPGLAGNEEPAPPPRVEAIGPGEWQGRPCTRYNVFEDNIKSQEICSAPLSQVNGAAEMMDTFQGMARFVMKLSESLPGPLGNSFNDNPGMVMELIGGFPVHTIEFSMGKPSSQVSLESIEERQLDPALFTAPDNYRLEDPFAGR